MSEWRQVELGQIADVRVSNVDKKTVSGEVPVQLCNYMDVYSNDYIRDHLDFMQASATVAEIARFKVALGDVLITKDSETPDDIGIPSVVIHEVDNLVCGYHVALIKPNKSLVDSVYLSKQLGRAETAGYFARYAAGSTRYGLPMGAMNRTPIALPTLTQQRKIATILSTIDTAIEQTEALIEKYQHIKAGLMHDLFTRGVLPTGQLRPPREQAPELYQETAIGWIPREWKAIPLDSVLSRIDAGWSPECQETPPGIGEWGVLKVSAVTRGVYDPSESKVLPQKLRPDPSIEVSDGDVILTRANGVAELVGVTVQVKNTPSNLMLSDKLLRLVPVESLMTKNFLTYAMQSNFIKSQIDGVMSGSSGQRNIAQSQIRKFICNHPTIEEQVRIDMRLSAVDEALSEENRKQLKLQKQKLGLMQDLLTGKVSVTPVAAQEIATP